MGEERGVQGLDGENHLHFVIGEDFRVTPKPLTFCGEDKNFCGILVIVFPFL